MVYNRLSRDKNGLCDARRDGFSFRSQRDEQRRGVYPILRAMVITVIRVLCQPAGLS